MAAAGFILAATFAILMMAGNSLLSELGFAVSFGIVVSAFVMAMFFTPLCWSSDAWIDSEPAVKHLARSCHAATFGAWPDSHLSRS